MSVNLPSIFSQQFATNVELLLQQKGSKLRPYVGMASYVGKQAQVVDQLGAVEMQQVVTRFSPKTRVDAAVDSRWVLPSDWDLSQLIDNYDKLKMLVDPQSSYVQNAVFAAGRKADDLIIDAFFGTAKTGETGATSTSFPAANQVAVNFESAANSGLTVAKLREAKRLLMSYEVDLDMDPLTAIVTAKQHDNLLKESQVISTDFNEKPVLVEGKITRFMGINIIHCERLDVDGSSYRRIPVFAKSGMHLGLWKDKEIDIDKRKDLTGNPWEVYLMMSMGATRTQENKVIEIKCAE